MAPVLEISHTIPSSDPFASFATIAVEAIFWTAARLRDAGGTILSACYLPSGFVGWIARVLTEALGWLYAIFVTTVEIVVLVAGTVVGCMLVLLVLVAVCKMLRRSGWMYRGMTSCEMLVVSAADQKSVREREPKLGTREQLCYGTMEPVSSETTISRTTIEESRGLGWRRTIWQTVTRHSYGSRGSTSTTGGGNQSAEETKDEKSDEHVGD